MLSEREKRRRLARELAKLNPAALNPVGGREHAGLRPVLVLSQDIFNRHSETVIAMAITSQPQKARFPLTFDLPRDPAEAFVGEILADADDFSGPAGEADRGGEPRASVDRRSLTISPDTPWCTYCAD